MAYGDGFKSRENRRFASLTGGAAMIGVYSVEVSFAMVRRDKLCIQSAAKNLFTWNKIKISNTRLIKTKLT